MTNKKYIRILFVLYLVLLIKVIVFKYPLQTMRQIVHAWRKDVLWEGLSGANFELFRTIKLYIRHWDNKGINSFGNLVGNIIAFIPLGYLMPRLHKIFENLFVCMATALLFILGIEMFQLFSAFGIFDVDDILLNGLGTFIGYLSFVLMKALVKRREKKSKKL